MRLGKLSKIILTTAIILTVIAIVFINQHYKTVIVDIPKFNHQQNNQTGTNANQKSKIINPKSVNLLVPFTPQAPTANWDQLHNEACEEAGAIMANEYYNGLSSAATPGSDPGSSIKPGSGSRLSDALGRDGNINLPADYVEEEISKLTKWQDENFGYHLDTTSKETAKMMEEVYGLKTKLLENFTAQDIKKELAQNHLVIISENGRLLGNPFYKSPGPIHHMLLIKGYDDKGNFITNDSGTKRGLNYPYTFDTLYNAAADWDHATNNVDQNKKIAIVVWK